MSCKDCKLHKLCKNSLIWGRGAPASNCEVMIVQEYPTYFDDRCGTTLTGDTKAKLNYLLEKTDIDFRKVYVTSAVKCQPRKGSNIKPQLMNECRKYLFQEISDQKPKVIIAMGRWAWNAVSEYTSIREFRGHFDNFELDYQIEVNGQEIDRVFECKVMPTWGLNASIKKWEYNDDLISDFKKVKKYVDSGRIDKTKIPKVNTILTASGLNDFVEKYRELKYVTTDFETTGFDFWQHKIINAGYCGEDDKADIIYLEPYKSEHMAKYDKKKGTWTPTWDKENIQRARQINSFLKYNRNRILKALKTVNGFDHLKFILHNGKFDAKFAAKYGIAYKNFWFDTLVADPLIDENLGHSLNIAMERRGINYGAYDTKLWKYINKDENKKKSYQYIPPLLLEDYLGIDVAGDRRLWQAQTKELKAEGIEDHFFNRKMPALRNLLRMEYAGIKYDKRALLLASKSITRKQDRIRARICKLTGIGDFNPNSNDQVSNYLVDAGYPLGRLDIKETTKGYSTAKDELTKFLRYKKWSQFPQLILNYKKLMKIKGTYIDGKDGEKGFLQYIDENNRIHGNYNMWTPRTSRYSSSRPALQVFPRPIPGLINTRNFIIPTNKKWCLFEADYSQLEQCVVAALSKDPVLIQRIQDGIDLHCINAADLGVILGTIPDWVKYEHMMVANDKADDLNDPAIVKEILKDIEKHGEVIPWKEKRTQAKGIGFGLNYGKGKKSFAEDFNITEDDAEEMIDAYFEIYHKMFMWREGIVAEAWNEGFISLPSGRKRRFHSAVDWLKSEYAEDVWSTKIIKEEIGRQAMNTPVQGGAHEVFEPACTRLVNRMRKEGLKARLLLSIHDGIVGECPIEERLKVKQCIEEEMPHTFNKGTKQEIKLKVDTDFYEWEWYGKKIKIT